MLTSAPPAATYYTLLPSLLGDLLLTSNGTHLTGLYMPPHKWAPSLGDHWVRDDPWFAPATAQLAAYFAGDLTSFDLPLAPSGTPFQMRVWEALRAIPYGQTASYGQVAARIGQPTASRAVGLANGRNPISIIVPCHRVIGASGSLTGYGGGLDRKQVLLALESRGRRPEQHVAALV